MKRIVLLALAMLGALVALPASAQLLTFAGLNGNNTELVQEFYNGGTGSLGSTGPNFGVSFTGNALSCSLQPGGSCNSAGLPAGDNMLVYLSGQPAFLNAINGFSDSLSLLYSSVNVPAVLNIYSGLDGTGTLLATLALPTTTNGVGDPACFGTNFCPYSPASVSFVGTALSVDFGGTTNQVAFGRIQLGNAVAAAPEPSTWAFLIFGFGAAGSVLRRRRRSIFAFV